MKIKKDIINKIIVTPYNWSLLLLTGLIFTIFHFTVYFSTGYDRYSNWFNYVILFSIGSLLVRYLKDESKDRVGEYGALNLILSMLTLLFAKSLMPWTFMIYIQTYCLLPMSIFMFLLLIKEVVININGGKLI